MANPKILLDQHQINPKKNWGQNFLHDPNALEKIVATAELMPEDIAVEIGTGTGTLTAVLAKHARQLRRGGACRLSCFGQAVWE